MGLMGQIACAGPWAGSPPATRRRARLLCMVFTGRIRIAGMTTDAAYLLREGWRNLSWWGIGADVGEMLTGRSAVTAAYVWTQGTVHAWNDQNKATRARNWHGYIAPGGINSWNVRLAEEPT